MSIKTRPQFSTALPYPKPAWPVVSQDVEKTALSLLRPLLTPVGDHRRQSKVSKGRNRSKRKRNAHETTLEGSGMPPGGPEISPYLNIGLARVLRMLQSGPAQSIVLCHRASIPEPAQESLLLLITAASGTLKSSDENANPILLVPIGDESEKAIAASLALPRASMISISAQAPGAESLEMLLQEMVPSVQVPWLQMRPQNGDMPLQVHTSHIEIKSRRGKPKEDESQ